MKAITLWQPWASLLAIGAKQHETRSWKTSYRGPVAIHAAKINSAKNDHLVLLERLIRAAKEKDLVHGKDPFVEAASKAFKDNNIDWPWLPCGKVIATADLVNCWRIVQYPGADIDRAKHIQIGAELDVPKKHPDFGRYIVPTETEMLFGDWTPGRYAWEFQNVKIFDKPISAKGKQGLWNWEPQL